MSAFSLAGLSAVALTVWLVLFYFGQKIESRQAKIIMRIIGYAVLVYVVWGFYQFFAL